MFHILTTILVAVLVIPVSETADDFYCDTPDGKSGQCIEVEKCRSVWSVLVNKDHLRNGEVSAYLRQIQCGIHVGSHKVCCQLEDVDKEDIDARVDTSSNVPKFQHRPPKLDHKPRIRNHINLYLINTRTCGKYRDFHAGSSPANFSYIGDIYFNIKDSNGVKSTLNKCIATLIVSNFALVPAHCVVIPEQLSIAYVQFKGRNYYIDKVIVHPYYNEPLYANDIALIRLSEEVVEDVAVPICLPVEREKGNEDIISTSKKEGNSYLENNFVKFVSNSDCMIYFGNTTIQLTSGQYCGVVQNPLAGNSDTYNFDQANLIGSIIQKYTKSEQFVFSGFTSTTIRTSQYIEEKPYIYTNVGHYIEWILDNLGDGFSSPPPPTKDVKSKNRDNRRRRGLQLLDNENCGPVVFGRRIVGGNISTINEFPWAGLIKYKVRSGVYSFECGASLISDRYVVTAAHCIEGIPFGYKVEAVRLGEYDLKTAIDCQVFDETDENGKFCNPPVQDIPVEKLIPHPEYNTPKYANDIALIRLAHKPEMGRKNIAPICLPLDEYYKPPNVPKHVVIGWGVTETGAKSNVLLKLSIPYVPFEECQRLHGRSITLSPGHSCFGGEDGKDSCRGDSGGSLQYGTTLKGNRRSAIVLVGVVAAGHDQCSRGSEGGFPGIYSNVSYYLDWILDNMTE